jgi:hypothetical protein
MFENKVLSNCVEVKNIQNNKDIITQLLSIDENKTGIKYLIQFETNDEIIPLRIKNSIYDCVSDIKINNELATIYKIDYNVIDRKENVYTENNVFLFNYPTCEFVIKNLKKQKINVNFMAYVLKNDARKQIIL